MSRYVFPAIFTATENGSYSVLFPDLDGCYTCGDNLADAVYMASDVLALTLWDMEEDGMTIPISSGLEDLAIDKNSFTSYIAADTTEYRKKHCTKAVKRTVSLPQWLDELAISNNINFSQTLQNALKAQLL